jgi:hypothetical protein
MKFTVPGQAPLKAIPAPNNKPPTTETKIPRSPVSAIRTFSTIGRVDFLDARIVIVIKLNAGILGVQ